MADFDYKNEMMNRIMLDSSLRRQVERQNAAPPVDDESYVHKLVVGADDDELNDTLIMMHEIGQHMGNGADMEAAQRLSDEFQGDDAVGMNPIAESLLSQLLYNGGKTLQRQRYAAQLFEAEKLKWLQVEANEGHKYAQYCLGLCYNDGIGTSRDPALAYKFNEMAALQGLPAALYQRGYFAQHYPSLLEEKYSSTADSVFNFYKMAAEAGHFYAQYLVGSFLLNGQMGQEKDEEAGLNWLLKASKVRLPEALMELGNHYAKIDHPGAKASARAFYCENMYAPEEAERALHALGPVTQEEFDWSEQNQDKKLDVNTL